MLHITPEGPLQFRKALLVDGKKLRLKNVQDEVSKLGADPIYTNSFQEAHAALDFLAQGDFVIIDGDTNHGEDLQQVIEQERPYLFTVWVSAIAADPHLNPTLELVRSDLDDEGFLAQVLETFLDNQAQEQVEDQHERLLDVDAWKQEIKDSLVVFLCDAHGAKRDAFSRIVGQAGFQNMPGMSSIEQADDFISLIQQLEGHKVVFLDDSLETQSGQAGALERLATTLKAECADVTIVLSDSVGRYETEDVISIPEEQWTDHILPESMVMHTVLLPGFLEEVVSTITQLEMAQAYANDLPI